jgi:hypothetical protein
MLDFMGLSLPSFHRIGESSEQVCRHADNFEDEEFGR